MIETLISTRACLTATQGPHVETCRINERQTEDEPRSKLADLGKTYPPHRNQLPPAASSSSAKSAIKLARFPHFFKHRMEKFRPFTR